MLTIALTGGIACGKSTVAQMLARLGASIIDADAISRSLTAAGGKALAPIREAFGSEVFHADGKLNRPALSQAVFGNEQALARLNAITHPLIQSEMEAQLEACRKRGDAVVVLDVPLLFEAHMEHMGDVIACAVCPQEVQISRMEARNGFTRGQALARILSQMPVSQKAALSHVTIDTNLPLSELEEAVRKLYDGWLAAARKENP